MLLIIFVGFVLGDFSPEQHLVKKNYSYPDEAVTYFGGMIFPNLTYMKIPMPEAHYNCSDNYGMAVLITPKTQVYNIIHITGDIVISGNDTSNVLGFGWGMAPPDTNNTGSFNAFACWNGTPWIMYVAVGCWNLSAWNWTCP